MIKDVFVFLGGLFKEVPLNADPEQEDYGAYSKTQDPEKRFKPQRPFCSTYTIRSKSGKDEKEKQTLRQAILLAWVGVGAHRRLFISCDEL